jgi:periplasmic protein TonB
MPLGTRNTRHAALTVSLFAHAALMLFVFFVVPPAMRQTEVDDRAVVPTGLVFLSRTEAGAGGGGGGGERSPLPARLLRTVGTDAMAIPVARATPIVPPRTLTEPPVDRVRTLELDLPVRRMDAGEVAMMGAIDGSIQAPPGSRGPGSGDGAGGGNGPSSGPGNGRWVGIGNRDGFGPGDGGGADLRPPVPLDMVKPKYTPDAMRARLQGEVWVSAVVMPDGTVTDLRVLRSLDKTFGLDEQALIAVRGWRFKPGTLAGRPVPMQVSVAVGFTIR